MVVAVTMQEAIVLPPWIALAIRPRPGVWEYVRVNVSELAVEELTVPEYLQFKEELADGRWVLKFNQLEKLSLENFYRVSCFQFSGKLCS